MHQKIKKRAVPLIFSLLFIGGVATWLVHAATSVRLYVAPASNTVAINQTFNVAIRADTSGNAVNYVRAYLNFPADKLTVTGISAAGSNFDYQLEQSLTSSQAKITRYISSGTRSGDLLVATITFKATAAGVASLSFDGSSLVYNTGGGSTQTTTVTNGGTYTISAPPAPTPPPVTSPPVNSPPSTSSPRPPSQTSQPAPTLGYTPTLPSDVTSIPSSKPNNADSYFSPYIGLTFPVEFSVLTASKKPAPKAKIQIGELIKETDKGGKASFDLPPGQTSVKISYMNATKTFTVNVEEKALPLGDGATDPQRVSVVMPKSGGISALKVLEILGVLMLLATMSFGAFLFWKGKRHRSRRASRSQRQTISEEVAAEGLTIIPSAGNNTAAGEPTPSVLAAPPAIAAPVSPPLASPPARSKPLHPHSIARTIKRIKKSVGHKPAAPHALPPLVAAPPVGAPPPMAPPLVSPKPVSMPMPPPNPEPVHQPPAPVDPYKPGGEPKDIFEMAEERFNQDDRLKDFR